MTARCPRQRIEVAAKFGRRTEPIREIRRGDEGGGGIGGRNEAGAQGGEEEQKPATTLTAVSEGRRAVPHGGGSGQRKPNRPEGK